MEEVASIPKWLYLGRVELAPRMLIHLGPTVDHCPKHAGVCHPRLTPLVTHSLSLAEPRGGISMLVKTIPRAASTSGTGLGPEMKLSCGFYKTMAVVIIVMVAVIHGEPLVSETVRDP